MNNPLNYVDVEMPEDCIFKISPSQFSKFIESPHQWYRGEVLKEKGFTHNTSSVLGTVVHYCCEQAAKGEPVDQNVIDEYVFSYNESEDYDTQTVLDNYKSMAMSIVNSYVMPNRNEYIGIEMQGAGLVKDGYYVGGTLDALQGSKDDCMIVDYKSYNSKTKPKSIPMYYKYQLLVYAFMLSKLGYNVTRVRLVYVNRNIDGGISENTGKPLKSYPPETTVLTHNVTSEDMEFISSCLDLCVDTIEASKKHPELNHVIWHDNRLKEA